MWKDFQNSGRPYDGVGKLPLFDIGEMSFVHFEVVKSSAQGFPNFTARLFPLFRWVHFAKGTRIQQNSKI